MGLALTRTAPGYRFLVGKPRQSLSRQAYGELGSKFCILALFSSMSVRIAQNTAQTGHVTGLLLLASEALVVALTLFRRSAGTVDRTWMARILTVFSTFGPPLVRPEPVTPWAPELLTIAISAIGLMVVVAGKLSLGRSFGLTPANRGVVCTGLYRFLRHPIYLGYLITHVGFVISSPGDWNLGVLALADLALMLRAIREERTLAQDDAYRAYMERVRWRIVPGLF
ncbi:MAG TPA: methyltransferase [Vicinamibacterales bacterium]|nr:methyltransferase [Vicinamibacterales bacterium]